MRNITNIRDFKRVYMIEVVEGEGTRENPSRIVRYFYDDDTEFLAKYDPISQAKPTEEVPLKDN